MKIRWKKKTRSVVENTVMSTLDTLHTEYVANDDGHQGKLRMILQRAQRVHLKLLSKKSSCRKFLKQVAKARKLGGLNFRGSNVGTAVMMKITGGQSRRPRQYASKYGKVLNVLAARGVAADKTAAEIKKRGGLEEIIKGARTRAKDNSETGTKQRRSSMGKKASECEARSTAQNRELKRPTITNNQEVLCEVFMHLADQDEVRKIPTGTEIILRAIRIRHGRADMKITGLKLKSLSDEDEDDDGE